MLGLLLKKMAEQNKHTETRKKHKKEKCPSGQVMDELGKTLPQDTHKAHLRELYCNPNRVASELVRVNSGLGLLFVCAGRGEW